MQPLLLCGAQCLLIFTSQMPQSKQHLHVDYLHGRSAHSKRKYKMLETLPRRQKNVSNVQLQCV